MNTDQTNSTEPTKEHTVTDTSADQNTDEQQRAADIEQKARYHLHVTLTTSNGQTATGYSVASHAELLPTCVNIAADKVAHELHDKLKAAGLIDPDDDWRGTLDTLIERAETSKTLATAMMESQQERHIPTVFPLAADRLPLPCEISEAAAASGHPDAMHPMVTFDHDGRTFRIWLLPNSVRIEDWTDGDVPTLCHEYPTDNTDRHTPPHLPADFGDSFRERFDLGWRVFSRAAWEACTLEADQ